ncbi:GspH/FimT family pseudopilin [Luteimonas sp. SJ-92]|uniref:Type II secretion system protein H n=1 Tax=Luteimonas salinisoli TaxID=2752307 RepID=A0A853JG83_9GAMM|nr:GspH/FimT family pseudopilin [Luteimonas salinisoli]NZA28413.1 GspH/FimT family pseudopilin [Luteimonas salinisoli]
MKAMAARRCATGFAGNPAARGFSLLEVLVVVALIAVASLLAVGALGGGIERIQLRSSAKEIAANLRYTRAHALATGAPQEFAIDPVAHSWRAPGGRSGSIPKKLEIVFTGAREVQPREGEGAIVFFDDGASTGGRVRLQSGSAGWNVDVAWLTGEVRMHRAEGRP